ncbi:MAG: hypothetical protein SNJ63_00770, partial [Sphingomonadaceae bacterium]
MNGTVAGIGVFSHLIAVGAFGLIAIWLLVQPRQRIFSLFVSAGSFVTAAWAGLVALQLAFGSPGSVQIRYVGEAETLRTGVWLAVLILVLQRPWGLDRRPRSSFLLAALLGFAVALALVLGTVTNADMPGPAASA